MLALDAFGCRIMICGPSNSGKSTLAVALSDKLGLPVVHLDLLRHLPDTNWQRRPDEEFRHLHDTAIEDAAWIIDGNYSALLPQRLGRATGIILLDDNRWANLARYFRRTLLQPRRAGNLPGARDGISLAMIHWIMVAGPENLRRYRTILPAAGLPFIEVRSMSELKKLYAAWGLIRA